VLAELAPGLRPDLAVFALYLGNDLAQNDEWEARADGRLVSRVREYPVRQSGEVKLVRLVKNAFYGVRQGRSEKEGEWLPFEGYLGLCERTLGAEAEADYAEADALVGELAAKAASLGVPLLVVMLPYRSMVEADALASLERKVPDLATRYDLSRPAQEMSRRLAARRIDHVDATAFLVEEHGRTGERLFFPIDGHLTEAGHRAISRFLAPLVRERLERNR
jgi:hypothetical protein